MSAWCWVISPYYDFRSYICCFRCVIWPLLHLVLNWKFFYINPSKSHQQFYTSAIIRPSIAWLGSSWWSSLGCVVTWLRSSSWQWQFIGVWTAAHHRTCRTTASRSPLGGVPPTVNYLQYLVTGSTLTAVGLFQLPAPQSGTLSQTLSKTRPPVQTVSDVCLKCICSLDSNIFSALEVLDDNCAL